MQNRRKLEGGLMETGLRDNRRDEEGRSMDQELIEDGFRTYGW
jgi:hypothetical protein